MTTIKILDGKMRELWQKAATVKEEAGPDFDIAQVKIISGDYEYKVAQIEELFQEIDRTGEQLLKLRSLAQQTGDRLARWRDEPAPAPTPRPLESPAARPDFDADQQKGSRLSLSYGLTEEVGYKSLVQVWGHQTFAMEKAIDLKNVLADSSIAGSAGATGWPSYNLRSGLVVPYATQPVRVLDLIPVLPTGLPSAVPYMEETTYDNQANFVGQSLGIGVSVDDGVLPESSLGLTERQAPIRDVGHMLTVTRQQVEDVPQIEGYLDRRLPEMVMQQVDKAVLISNGNGASITGIKNVTGIQTQARGSDTNLDALFKAANKVRNVGFATPTGIIMSPTAWEVTFLARGNDQYLMGSPANAATNMFWGLPVAVTNALGTNEAIVGDFMTYSQIWDKRSVIVEMTNGYNDYFVRQLVAVRAVARMAFAALRPLAFCQVTGLS